MATLESMIPMVRKHVRNCPDPVMTTALLDAARDFCRETKYLREALIISLVSDIPNYALTPTDSEEEAIGIKAAALNGIPLKPSSPEEVQGLSGTPGVFWFLPSRQIFLNPTPTVDAIDALEVSAIKQPTLAATAISNQLLLQHDWTIAHKAIAELFSMPDAAWSRLQLVDFHEAKWKEGYGKARAHADRQHRPFGFRTAPGW